MLNTASPSLNWQLYDYYLDPAGAYFGAKKANEPVSRRHFGCSALGTPPPATSRNQIPR
jgi:hypothetical protein